MKYKQETISNYNVEERNGGKETFFGTNTTNVNNAFVGTIQICNMQIWTFLRFHSIVKGKNIYVMNHTSFKVSGMSKQGNDFKQKNVRTDKIKEINGL